MVERGFVIPHFGYFRRHTCGSARRFRAIFRRWSKAAIPIGATLGVLLISGATQVHRRVRTRLDRAFFRSAYDAQQILEDLAATTLTVTDREGLAELLHQHIHDALHPMPLFIYLDNGQGQFYAYAGHPPVEAMTLSPDGRGQLRCWPETDPIDLNPEELYGTPLEHLRQSAWYRSAAPSEGQLQGWMVLGPRLSEEPYSTRDKRLLASVASQAGIAMRSISLAEKMAERMEAERRSRAGDGNCAPGAEPPAAAAGAVAADPGLCRQMHPDARRRRRLLRLSRPWCRRLGLVLADISGKGMSGALLMANLQANLRGQYALALEDFPRLLRSVNYLFYKNTETNNYATTFFSIYDDESRTLALCELRT